MYAEKKGRLDRTIYFDVQKYGRSLLSSDWLKLALLFYAQQPK
jgi:hypothetical protein